MSTWKFPPPLHSWGTAAPWDTSYWITMIMMWWTMMIAMMIPSAAPTILLYASVCRHASKKAQMTGTAIPAAEFGCGYLLAWLVFSVLATLLQWSLEQAGLLHAILMWSTSRTLSGMFLIAGGIYQLSPLKNTCLKHCRSPAEFISRYWMAGRTGAMRMGFVHGLYCVACCWLLMLLLFVGGIMNLVWIAGLTVVVLLEKLAPFGFVFARSSGALMMGIGGYLLFSH
ncbi:MAG TPA: DUF2182 domain-containing protein [Woeseiaceae bacterium]|nr:DUF2182 domain-containing protein [Woeseiaceae bacterium]